jgi:DNA-binding NarL/FixJ family response regulator
MTRVRVLIVDDHPIFRDGLRTALAGDDIEVVGEVAGGHEAAEVAATLQPDVVLMDLQMPHGTGIEATRTIAAAQPATAILVLTMSDDADAVFGAVRAGARGYLLKGADREELRRAIHAVAEGEAIFGAEIAQRLLGAFAGGGTAAPLPQLTEREREVLALVTDGYTNSAIAGRLFVSAKTVRNHVSNILTKLQVADRQAAADLAREAGLRHPRDGGR